MEQEDIGAMMEAQFAVFRPYSKTGMRLKAVSERARGKKGIKLSAVACLWLSRKVTNVG